jgi:hypothetical protein
LSLFDSLKLLKEYENEAEWFFEELKLQHEEDTLKKEIRLIEILEHTNYLNGGIKNGLKLFKKWKNDIINKHNKLINRKTMTVFDKIKDSKKNDKSNTLFSKLKWFNKNKRKKK